MAFCTVCRAFGHRRDGRCPQKNVSPPTPPPDNVVPFTPPLAAVASPDADLTAEIAALREALDAINEDIALHQKVRDRIDERMAESRERRAELEIEIRRFRARLR